jgi:hypothetical protein
LYALQIAYPFFRPGNGETLFIQEFFDLEDKIKVLPAIKTME